MFENENDWCSHDELVSLGLLDDDTDSEYEVTEEENDKVDPIEFYLNSPKKNVLYFIQVSTEFVKIGSASNVQNFKKRLEECSRWVSNPYVLGIAFCDRRVEKHIHNSCHSWHVKAKGKEIFNLDHDLKVVIGNLSDWSIYGSEFGSTEHSENQCSLDEFLEDPFKVWMRCNGYDDGDLIEDEDDYGRPILTLR